MDALESAISAIRKGGIAIVYDGDGREGEADIILSAAHITPRKIEMLRKDAGGLICAAISAESAKAAGLPFYTDILESSSSPALKSLSCRKTAYGDRPSFSVSINHSGVYTGITDNDRALTIGKLDMFLRLGKTGLSGEFYSPGHVFLLIGRGIGNRQGHTELALELGRMAGMGNGAMVMCEMLGSGSALPKEEAESYAKKRGFAFIEGKELVGGPDEYAGEAGSRDGRWEME